jgi:hypothetical protein
MYIPTSEELERLITLGAAEGAVDPSGDDTALFELGLVDEDDGGDVELTEDGRRVAKALSTDPNEGAARLIRAALRIYTGRRLMVDRWRPIAAVVLQRKRLSQAKFDAVLRIAEERGILQVDRDSGSYPFLVALDDPEPEPELEPELEPESEEKSEDRHQQRVKSAMDRPVPEDWDPPSYLDCGHLDWWSTEQHASARADGFCCAGGQEKRPVNHRFTRGEYRKPVPQGMRRTPAKVAMGGFPGLVCDAEGYYIGGVTNRPAPGSKP